MRHPPLSPREIHRLDEIYCSSYRLMLDQRRHEPLAAHIHLPKLPELLSISIAVQVGPKLLGEELVMGLGRQDLATSLGDRIAVKGTGPSQWIRITQVDRAARWLLWVDYAARIQGCGPIEVLAIDVERFVRSGPSELTRAQLAKRAPCVPSRTYHPNSKHGRNR